MPHGDEHRLPVSIARLAQSPLHRLAAAGGLRVGVRVGLFPDEITSWPTL